MVRLKTGQIVPPTDCEMKGNVANCIHPTQPQIYFHDGQVLSRIHTDTMKTANQGDGISLCPELTIDDNEETAFSTSFLTRTNQGRRTSIRSTYGRSLKTS